MTKKTMKAIVVEGFGTTAVLKIKEKPLPQPKADEILVRVHAAALNRADILQRQGKYPPPIGESTILGLEIAGEIAALGNNVKQFTLNQRIFGLVPGGGYAEYCCIDQGLAIAMPDNWDYIKAAAIPEAFLTANESVFELGQLQPGESILVHAGASGMGSTAIQMAKYIGAKVYFTAGSEEKIQRVLHLGADAGINYKTQDFATEIARLTEHQGVDVIEDFLGAQYLMLNLQSLAPAGRLLILAYMSGFLSELDLRLLHKNRLQIKGFVLRSRSLADKRQITQRFKERWLPVLIKGAIAPVIDSVFPWEQVKAAHERMEQRLNFGKIVLSIG
jgi:putative PIG3 family NAD(P)H quinone oxidoreductase